MYSYTQLLQVYKETIDLYNYMQLLQVYKETIELYKYMQLLQVYKETNRLVQVHANNSCVYKNMQDASLQ